MEELGERREACRRSADDRQHEPEAVPGGADDRLGAAAHAEPGRERSRLEMGYDVLVEQRRPQSCPSQVTGPPLQQRGEELGLLLEQRLVVGQVVAEQRERVDARTPPKDDLGPTAGDGVERRVALEHTDRVVRAQDRDRGAEVDAARARRDGAEHHVTGRHRKVVGVVLADPEEVDADLLGEDALFDDVADRLRVRQRPALDVVGDVAERVEAEEERERCAASRDGGLSGRDGLDRELDACGLADEQATGLERHVPGEPEVLAVDVGGGAEADALVADRGDVGAVEVDLQGDGPESCRGRSDRRRPPTSRRGAPRTAGGLEGDGRVVLDVEEVSAPQVGVAVGVAGAQAGGVDLHFDVGLLRLLGRS